MSWITVPIGTVIRSSQYGLSIPVNPDGNMPIVSMKDIHDGRVHIDPTVCVSLSKEEAKAFLLKDGDILLNRTNSPDLVGKVGIYRGTEQAVFASYLVRLELDCNLVEPDFIVQILVSEIGQRHIKQLSTRAISQSNLNPTTFKKHFYIPLPDLSKQTSILNVLLTWDTAIEKTEKLIKAKEKWFKWFIKSLICDQCSHWEHLHAEKIFKGISEKNNDDEELLSVTQDRGVIPRTMFVGRVMSPEGTTDGYKLVKKGDFVISLRSFQGGIEYSRYQGLISPAYTVLRPKLKIHDDFYRHFFKTYLFIEKYLNIAVIGIRDGKQISIPDFMTVKIPYPPIDQQKKIATVLNTARQEIDLMKKQAEAYRRQKRGLMQKLLTGKWRVKAAEEVS